MEQRRQEMALRIVSEGFARSTAEGQALLELNRSHAQVMVEFGAISVPGQPSMLGDLQKPE